MTLFHRTSPVAELLRQQRARPQRRIKAGHRVGGDANCDAGRDHRRPRRRRRGQRGGRSWGIRQFHASSLRPSVRGGRPLRPFRRHRPAHGHGGDDTGSRRQTSRPRTKSIMSTNSARASTAPLRGRIGTACPARPDTLRHLSGGPSPLPAAPRSGPSASPGRTGRCRPVSFASCTGSCSASSLPGAQTPRRGSRCRRRSLRRGRPGGAADRSQRCPPRRGRGRELTTFTERVGRAPRVICPRRPARHTLAPCPTPPPPPPRPPSPAPSSRRLPRPCGPTASTSPTFPSTTPTCKT